MLSSQVLPLASRAELQKCSTSNVQKPSESWNVHLFLIVFKAVTLGYSINKMYTPIKNKKWCGKEVWKYNIMHKCFRMLRGVNFMPVLSWEGTVEYDGTVK